MAIVDNAVTHLLYFGVRFGHFPFWRRLPLVVAVVLIVEVVVCSLDLCPEKVLNKLLDC